MKTRWTWLAAGLAVLSCGDPLGPRRLVGAYSGFAYSATTGGGIEGIRVRLNRDTLLAADYYADFSGHDSNEDGRWHAIVRLDVDENFCATVDSAYIRLSLSHPSGDYDPENVDAPVCLDSAPVREVSGIGVRMFPAD
jgi:hypothetical protein